MSGSDSTKGSVRGQFGASASNYVTSSVHASGPDLEKMLQIANLTGQEAVLDVGSGAGHTAIVFARGARNVTAVDITHAMLEQAAILAEKSGVTNINFKYADVEALPFDDDSFDLITCRYSAHHYPDLAKAVCEITRVLRPTGRFLLVDSYSPNVAVADTYLNAIEVLRDHSHVRDHSITHWLELLDSAGLTGKVVEVWGIRLEFGSWIARMNTPKQAAEQIRTLMRSAPSEVRDQLGFEPDGSFSIPAVLIEATKRT